MIVKKIFYGLKCDRCGRHLFNENGSAFFDNEFDLIDYAEKEEWLCKGEKHYCPECIIHDEKLIHTFVKEDIPNCVWKIKTFAESFLFSNYGSIFKETDKYFSIDGYFPSEKKGLTLVETQMLHQLADGYKVEVSMNKTTTSTISCTFFIYKKVQDKMK